MAVSKRLRFEIFRRDNHACRYCGQMAPEVKLTIDHVIPTTLGGSDQPGNLVTACAGCNAGKSSVPAGAPLVDDVAQDAIRWALAIERAAALLAARDDERAVLHEWFHGNWAAYTWTDHTGKHHVPLPPDWEATLDRFVSLGLPHDAISSAIKVAMGSSAENVFRYFCGVCWNRIGEMQEIARTIAATTEGEAL